MDTETLRNIISTRILASGGNPTSTSFFYSITQIINELEELRAENAKLKKLINMAESDNG